MREKTGGPTGRSRLGKDGEKEMKRFVEGAINGLER